MGTDNKGLEKVISKIMKEQGLSHAEAENYFKKLSPKDQEKITGGAGGVIRVSYDAKMTKAKRTTDGKL